MKNTGYIFALATLAVATLVSCSKEIDNTEVVDEGIEMKTITVKTSIDSKTTLDANHENIIWTANDQISIFNNVGNQNSQATYAAGEDITIQVPEGTTEIYAHYPYYSGNTTGPESVSVYISNNQTQKNPGELDGYYFPMVAKGEVVDDKAIISLYPVASALALNIYHTGLLENEVESVKSVKVTPTSNTNFIGRQTTNITGDNIVYSLGENSNPVTVTLTHYLSLGRSKPTNSKAFEGQIYVCLAKQSYSNVQFEIETDKGVYTITSNSTAFDLENNDFVPVNINLARASFEACLDPTAYSWTLVKDALAIGDKVVIAAAASDVAMSTTQNSNNRGQVAITKSDNVLTAVASVQAFEVVAGSVSNTVAFKCLNGDEITKYIAAAHSSNNYLHSNAVIDGNASWSIGINTTTGVASVVAQGSYTRNILQYNSNSSIFACYESASQGAVVFYRAGLPTANLSFPNATYSASLGETFTSPTLTNPYNVTVTYSSSNTSVATVDSSTGTVTLVGAGTTTITASFAGNSSYGASAASYDLSVIDPNAEQWVKTAIANITTNDVFVIVGGGYAVTNHNGTSSAPAAVAVQIANDALTVAPDANLRWKLTGNATDGYSFSPAGDANTFLYCNTTAASGSNDNIRVGTGARKVWTFNTAGIMMTKDDKTVRYFSRYNTQDWRGYVNTNSAMALEFYVKQGGSSAPETYAVTWSAPSGGTISATVGGEPISSGDVFEENTVVSITATPSSGYVFSSWSITGATPASASSATTTFTVGTSDVNVSATFTQLVSNTVTFSQPASGGSFTVSVDNANISSGASVLQGKTVTLSASALTGYVFKSWTLNGATVASTSSATTTFTMGTSPVTISATFEASEGDVLNRAFTGVSSGSSTYSNWTGTGASGADYSGNSAGGNDAIQLRSNNSNSGIVTTTSGGYVTKVKVTWENHTQTARTLNVYGKNSAYSSASDLYGNNSGDLIGTIVAGTSTELTIPYDYKFIGLRSDEGALYLSEIQIVWSATASGNEPPTPTYAVTWTSPSETGCSISATVDNVAINPGDKFEEGTVVTITAAAGTGYTFNGWTVTGSTVASSSSATTTFTIGTSAVTISASFTSGGGGQTATLQYTLTPEANSGNDATGYASATDISVNNIVWNVTGNTSLTPWRIGGKSLTGVDRALYSKTAIASNISKIVITHAGASSVTVNSMKVYICSSAAGAAASTPSDVVASFTPTFVANGNVTINKADDTSWAGCYYRIVYNVTIGGSNKFIAFEEAKFYGTAN